MFGIQISQATLMCLSVVVFASSLSSAFLQPSVQRISARSGLGVAQDIERPPTFLDEKGDDGDLSVLFVEDSEEKVAEESTKEKGAGRQRWENLNPKMKQRLIEKGQERAVANKQKREPAADKKRREYRQFQHGSFV
jgi:hypothetical protein